MADAHRLLVRRQSTGLAAISKIVSILLAALAVHLVRIGVTAILDGKGM